MIEIYKVETKYGTYEIEVDYPKVIKQTRINSEGEVTVLSRCPGSKNRKEYTDKKGTYIKIAIPFGKTLKVYK